MRRRISLQWQLTLMTAFIVTIACLSVSIFISRYAVFYMDEIEDVVVTVLPKEALVSSSAGDSDLYLGVTGDISQQIHDTKTEFWSKSLLVTTVITLIGSALTYCIVGYALNPLRRLGKRLEEIQAKNLQQKVDIKGASKEIAGLTESFNGMLQRLHEAFFVQRQFSGNAAHELRTPIAVMQTKLEVLRKEENLSEDDNAEALDMLQIQTERLSNVIDVLLEMTQLQYAKKTDNLSLSELAEEVLCDLAPLAEKTDVTLNQVPGDVRVLGNDTLLYRAIYNLVENAIKYNKRGGVVTVGISSAQDFAKVTVEDNGNGIEAGECDKIFEPFYRVDKSRSRAMGGAGLGLALVKEIAHQHGGDARVLLSSYNGTQIEMTIKKD